MLMGWARLLSVMAMGMVSGISASASGLSAHVVASGLENPWALAFIEDGRMLVTERPGRLRAIGAQGEVGSPITGLPPIQAGRQGGLLDLIVDRDYASNRTLYFCYTEPDLQDPASGKSGTALASAVLSLDRRSLQDLKVLFRQQPKHTGGLHFGCRIVDAGDGTLFLGLGDRYQRMQDAQLLDNHIGKIVRVGKDGSIPADNPWRGHSGVQPELWSYGHRNIQGAIMDADGQLWMHEHGPQGGDELNLIKPSLNYGWPVITYGEQYGGGNIGQGLTQSPGMEQPVVQWTPSIAPSGLAQITSDRYGPDWQGNFVLGSLKFRYLVRLQMDGQTPGRQEVLLPNLGQRVRDVRQGPDGLLYILTDQTDGQLIRLVPNQ